MPTSSQVLDYSNGKRLNRTPSPTCLTLPAISSSYITSPHMTASRQYSNSSPACYLSSPDNHDLTSPTLSSDIPLVPHSPAHSRHLNLPDSRSFVEGSAPRSHLLSPVVSFEDDHIHASPHSPRIPYAKRRSIPKQEWDDLDSYQRHPSSGVQRTSSSKIRSARRARDEDRYPRSPLSPPSSTSGDEEDDREDQLGHSSSITHHNRSHTRQTSDVPEGWPEFTDSDNDMKMKRSRPYERRGPGHDATAEEKAKFKRESNNESARRSRENKRQIAWLLKYQTRRLRSQRDRARYAYEDLKENYDKLVEKYEALQRAEVQRPSYSQQPYGSTMVLPPPSSLISYAGAR